MTASNKVTNYTPEQEQAIAAASPLDLDKAKELAAEIGKSYRSVIAKAKTMGIEYQTKAKPAKRPAGMTKESVVEAIQELLGTSSLDGLEKATAVSLARVHAALVEREAESVDAGE